MRKLLIALLTCLTLACSPPGPAPPSPEARQLDASLRWLSAMQGVALNLFAPFGHIPKAPPHMDRAGAKTWIVTSRAWIATLRAAVAQARTALAATPAPRGDTPEKLRAAMEFERTKLPGAIDGVEAFANDYEQTLDAAARGDAGAAQKGGLAMIDAGTFTLGYMRDADLEQSMMLAPDSPQRDFLQSVALSYGALIAVMGAQRAEIAGSTIDFAGVGASLRASATQMRAASAAGRALAAAAVHKFSAPGSATGDEALRARILAAFATYGATFDREDAIAAEIDGDAALIAGAVSVKAINAPLQAAQDRMAALDAARAEDLQARTRLLQSP